MSYSYPHLSTILDVYPECSTHCYGYAPSKGRRCKLPTKKDNRDKASRLLNYGTHLLQRGLSVDNLLIELAPLLLCYKHNDQADSLVSNWRAKLQVFQEQWLLAAVLKSLSEYADSRARELAEQRVEGGGLRPARPAVVETEQEEEEEEDEEEEEEVEGGREEPEPEPEASPVRTSTETSAPAVTSIVAESIVPRSETRTITRKPIEGDCEICMCPLRGQDSDEDGGEDSDDEDDNDVSDTASDDEDDDPEEDDDDLDDLVYCKNQCGSNYHKTCIDEWLATQSTFRDPRGNPICPSCPTCRAVWSS